MPRSRKDHEYIGVELPRLDLKILRRLGDDDDRPVGYYIRAAVAEWIQREPRALLIKAGSAGVPPAAKSGAKKLAAKR